MVVWNDFNNTYDESITDTASLRCCRSAASLVCYNAMVLVVGGTIVVVEVGWLLGSRKDPSYRILREGFSIYFCHQRCESGFFPPKLYTQIWREERYKNLLDPKDTKTFQI